jgi:hypothetical protein
LRHSGLGDGRERHANDVAQSALARVETHELTELDGDCGRLPFARIEHDIADAREVAGRRVIELAAQASANRRQAFWVELDLDPQLSPGRRRMRQIPHGTRKHDVSSCHAALFEQLDVLDRAARRPSRRRAAEDEQRRNERRHRYPASGPLE